MAPPFNRLLPALRSPLLTEAGFSHAFFTRVGGVSIGSYGSLNFTASTGDSAARVAQNRALAEDHLGVGPGKLLFASQVHGVALARADADATFEAFTAREADATWSRDEGVACGVRSADCGVILLGERETGSVLAIHAGWKGTVLGVVQEALKNVRRELGQPGDWVAAIGPHIEACCFEVGGDVADELVAASRAGRAAIACETPRRIDLRVILESILRDAGIARIDHVRGCTRCDEERFFSFRRQGAQSGRLLSAIVTRPARAA